MSENKLFDIMLNGKVVGHAPDANPIFYETEAQCLEQLCKIKSQYSLNEQENKLIAKCIQVIESKIDDDVEFGLLEIIELSNLAKKYPSNTNEIMACSSFLRESVNFVTNVPTDEVADLYTHLLEAYSSLSKMYNSGLVMDSDDSDNFADSESDSDDY